MSPQPLALTDEQITAVFAAALLSRPTADRISWPTLLAS
jgi:hypothetical protein